MMKFVNSLVVLLAVFGGVTSFKFASGEKQIVQDDKENKSESCQSHQLPMGVYSPWRKAHYVPPLTMAISELALAPVQSVTNQLARAMDEFERDWLGGAQSLRRSLAPYEGLLLDVKETPTSYEIQIDVPGVKKDDVEVKMHDRVLTIRTERKGMEEQETDTFRRVERYHGTMQRSVTLPESADEDKIKAECVDGVLHVTVHKKEGTKALPEKKIPVEYKETQKAR